MHRRIHHYHIHSPRARAPHHKYKHGKGINQCRCGHQYKQGEGIGDIFKVLMGIGKTILSKPEMVSQIVDTGKNLFNIGKNTWDIIKQVRQREGKGVKDVIKKINKIKLKNGRGFSYV